ncbi:fasciclin domain-containing protein [Gaoshiqia sp. Z1-71]|uniref:fasciclin domain-containing protein n=1 Tax=Gaoshiqia hydrogeniformans TaxID=3290090 RepID=UPI003BF8A6F9
MKRMIKSNRNTLIELSGFCLMLVLLLLVVHACQNQFSDARYNENDELQIMDYIDSHEDLSIYRELVEYTGKRNLLKTAGTYTVFVPNNQAFENLFDRLTSTGENVSSITDKSPEYWLNYFKYHLLNEKVNTNTLEPGPLPVPTVLNNKYVIADIRDSYSSIKLNNVATILEYNIEMSNGYINITDEVMSPPVETIFDQLTKTGKYSIMLDLIEEAGLTGYLKDSTITLFIERDEVLLRNDFDKETIPNLREWVEYHMIPDSGYFMNQLVKNRIYSLYPNEALTFSIDRFGKYSMNGDFRFDQSLEYGIDRVCLNGIYHSVDTVLHIVEAPPATIRLNLYPPGSPYGAQNVFTQAPARIVLNTGTQSYHQNKENKIMAFDAQQVGDFFELTFSDVPAGNYRIRLIHRGATSRGTFLVIYNDEIIEDNVVLSKSDGVFEEWSYLAYNYCGDITVATRSDVTLYFALTAFASGRTGSYCCDILMDMIELIPIID